MKILRNKKALSPVVASIILIAVTVAVSIAVAAWMGALTIGFMGSSSITITNVRFEGTTAGSKYINCTLKNSGTNMVTIASVKINNSPVSASDIAFDSTHSSGSYASGATGWVRIKYDWVAGNPYKIDLYDGSGQVVGSYQATAPQ
ncbi:MAG: archaellin/type IV pilin N-terminal domain-containing protein [Candidatus Bathyarchaeia archaeon]